MLSDETLSTVLYALAIGDEDRAAKLIATSTEIEEDVRASLARSIVDGAEPADQARRLGDALRSLGAAQHLVNECYRASFYLGDEWPRLSSSELFAYFTANRAGRPLDKWVHYFPIYERHLARFRGRPVRVLEIGVYRGGGLELFQHFLGSQANLVGIDIDTAAREAVGDRFRVEVGDQADPEFLRGVADRHGPFDVVVDDGGHTMRQQIVAVEALFPVLNNGGSYFVEDCHTSYWTVYADAPVPGLTFIGWLKERLDDIHAYHHSRAQHLTAPWQTQVAGIHVYDSLVVLDKNPHLPPFSETSGTREFIANPRTFTQAQIELVATRDAARNKLQDVSGELQDTTKRLTVLQDENDSLVEELTHARGDLHATWQVIEAMRRSRSWRITSPLRRAKAMLLRR
jgi:cephalosporin hydroxylase